MLWFEWNASQALFFGQVRTGSHGWYFSLQFVSGRMRRCQELGSTVRGEMQLVNVLLSTVVPGNLWFVSQTFFFVFSFFTTVFKKDERISYITSPLLSVLSQRQKSQNGIRRIYFTEPIRIFQSAFCLVFLSQCILEWCWKC